MKFCLLLILTMYAVLSAGMAEGHTKGKALAGSLLGGVQAAASTSPATVPGFVTDSPKEASLDNGSIGGAISAEVRSNEAAEAISENSSKRQKFVLDPTTDPLFINANQATANPEQTMQEMVVETPDGSGGDQDEMVECMEGGEEYIQTCRKQLVLKIQIIPEVRTCSCAMYWWFPTHGHHHNLQSDGHRWAGENVTPQQVEILSEEWVGCEHLEELSDQGRCYYVERIHGESETREVYGSCSGLYTW